jgi:N-acetylglucosamine kinase-like BadF-type ATPase
VTAGAGAFYVAGIDGGQSSTTAVIGDREGRTIGRGRAGPADEIGAAPESTRLHDALRDALRSARDDAGLPESTQFAAVVAGISGYEGRVYGIAPQLPATRLVLLHDGPIAHAGALDGEAGIVVIAGTGSVVYASDGSKGRTFGGWGYLFGDEGSAFWFVREALSSLMRRQDAGEPDGCEAQAACRFFGVPTLRRLVRAHYAGEIARDRLAAFAPEALGFESLRPIADRGADRLSELIAAAVSGGAAPTVAYVGGMFADAIFRSRFSSAVLAAVPGARIVEPRRDPSAGALLLAYREAGAG